MYFFLRIQYLRIHLPFLMYKLLINYLIYYFLYIILPQFRYIRHKIGLKNEQQTIFIFHYDDMPPNVNILDF